MKSAGTILILSSLLAGVSFGQDGWSIGPPLSTRRSVNATPPLLILDNGISPSAAMTNRGDVICVATKWVDHYPLIAERVESSGRLHWNTVQLSNPQSSLDQNGRCLLLPRSDGGAYFVYEYWEFRGRIGDVELYASYPYVQSVDPAGNIEWGTDGKRLTNKIVGYQGGATILLVNYSPEGDLVVYWSWFETDSLFHRTYGVYSQKVASSTGERLWGDTGRMLFDQSPVFTTSTSNGTTYIGHGDSVACFDPGGGPIGDHPVWTGITGQREFAVGTNDHGELLILYTTGEGIKGRLYHPDGRTLWTDKLIMPSVSRIPPSTKLVNWANARWIFKMGAIGSSIFCVDRTGIMCWGDSGVRVSDRVMEAVPIDDQNVVVAYQEERVGQPYEFDLKVQRTDQTGELKWGPNGIGIADKVGTTCRILPDSSGGAYIIFDALALYEPAFRPRGTYLQKVDREGNLGIVTSVQSEAVPQDSPEGHALAYPNPFTGTTTIQLASAALDRTSDSRLAIYDILGREVNTLSLQQVGNRRAQYTWDGKDRFGINTPPGLYFYVLRSSGRIILHGKLLRTN